jgi:hypothetical protein
VTWQQVVSENPYLTFFLIIFSGCGLLNFMMLCWNRFLRCMNIRKHGWPPVHCDADGDFRPKPNGESLADG